MMVDLKRTKADKAEEVAEAAPTAASQPDYGYGLCIHLEDEEIEKLGLKNLPSVGDEFHIMAIGVVKGVSERDYGGTGESCVDLQITMMELKPESEEPMEMEDVASERSEMAEARAVGGKTVMHSAYRGRR